MQLAFQPSETGILIIDVQKQFCCPKQKNTQKKILNTKATLLPQRIEKFLQSIRDQGFLFIYTRTIGNEEVIPENVKFFREIRGFHSDAPREHEESELCFETLYSPSIVVEKPCFDAFAHTNLKEELQKRRIRNLIICGVMTNVCVDATARRAVMEGYHTCILKDLVATFDQEVLDFFENYYGYVLNSTEVPYIRDCMGSVE